MAGGSMPRRSAAQRKSGGDGVRRSRAMLVAPIGLLALASCGSASSGPVTMAQFVSEANAICTASAASSAKVPQPSVASIISPSKSDLPAIATFLSAQVSILNSTVTRLRALGAPPSNGAQWNQGLAAIQTSIDDAKASQAAA